MFVVFRGYSTPTTQLTTRRAEPLFLPTGTVLQRVRRLCQTAKNRKKTTRNSQNCRSRANLTSKGLRNRRSRANLTSKGRRNRRSRANLASKAALGDLPCAKISLPLPAWPALPARPACLATKNKANLTSKSPRYRRCRANLTSKGPRNRRYKVNLMSKGP